MEILLKCITLFRKYPENPLVHDTFENIFRKLFTVSIMEVNEKPYGMIQPLIVIFKGSEFLVIALPNSLIGASTILKFFFIVRFIEFLTLKHNSTRNSLEVSYYKM